MKISLCVTVFNEESTIVALLDSLINQSKKADEIIIVDGGSSDKTVEIIRHFQKKYSIIKLVIEKSSRAKARNLAVEISRNNIVAMTDAGCIADRNWLKNITKPFEIGSVDVVAGFYKMRGKTLLQKAESVYLGVTPGNFDYNFLPSTRSIAFTKETWEEVGGFPENLEDAAEDTVFNYKLIKFGTKISRVKDATVEWGMPSTLKDFFNKIKSYSFGDAKSKITFFPGKGFRSHNIKAISILLRYLLGIIILILGFKIKILLTCLLIFILIYLFWAYKKVNLEYGNWKIAIWGPILQIISDLAVMTGFISGIIA